MKFMFGACGESRSGSQVGSRRRMAETGSNIYS
jgi:hypothetical protein